jgi:IS30 family transposase
MPPRSVVVWGKFNDAISIRDRPAEVKIAVLWLLRVDHCRSGNSFIATLAERSTRHVMLAKVTTRTATASSKR